MQPNTETERDVSKQTSDRRDREGDMESCGALVKKLTLFTHRQAYCNKYYQLSTILKLRSIVDAPEGGLIMSRGAARRTPLVAQRKRVGETSHEPVLRSSSPPRPIDGIYKHICSPKRQRRSWSNSSATRKLRSKKCAASPPAKPNSLSMQQSKRSAAIGRS